MPVGVNRIGTKHSFSIMKHFAFTCAPVADPRAVYIHGPLRVTILKHGVIRIEFEPDGKFEDRPSQHFWNRQQTAPEYQA